MPGGALPLRRQVLFATAALMAGCALPRDTALRDWARTASLAIDQPSMLPPGAAAASAEQQALVIYFYALAVLAEPEQPLTFRPGPYAALAPAAAAADPDASAAIAGIGDLLAAAAAGNIPSDARAYSAAPAPLIEDRRLDRILPSADPAVQVLLAALTGATGDGPGRDTYRGILRDIGESHAMLTSRGFHIRQRETSRDILAAEDRLLRLMRRLPPDPILAARQPPGGLVAAVVQP
jgi:hypothetical protein